ncbi:MAG: NAD(P)H-binding protein [Acidimicrobiales bacterium]|jgi:uncharacterized protein YbjT (DUF2867 family)
MRIAVAGGTGTAGRYAVTAGGAAGHQVVVLSRGTGVDVRSGSGLRGALDGVDVVIDALDGGTTNRARATAFFEESTARLQDACADAGVRRIVVLSIVGVDRVPGFGYYDAKLAQEAAARRGPVPVSIVRTTQFLEFAGQVLDRLGAGPVAPVPSMRIQPVAARTVGDRLVEVAAGGADPGPSELAGPEVIELVEMARRTVRRRGARKVVVPLRIPGAAGSALRAGALLAGPGAVVAGPGPDQWLGSGDFR